MNNTDLPGNHRRNEPQNIDIEELASKAIFGISKRENIKFEISDKTNIGTLYIDRTEVRRKTFYKTPRLDKPNSNFTLTLKILAKVALFQ